MAKIIYCLQIYLFRSQFNLTSHELTGLRTFCVFIIRIYVKAWYTCPCPSMAPRNLQLLNDLVEYKAINNIIARAALKSCSGQLWYLSEWLVGLSLFDSQVPEEIKVKITSRMQSERPTADSMNSSRRIKIEESSLPAKQLSDFASVRSKQLFCSLKVDMEFLKLHPIKWEMNDSYISAKSRVNSLKVVNDAAERGVALIQTFNAVLTNQEEQKQYLMQVVDQHRSMFPKPNKSIVVKDP